MFYVHTETHTPFCVFSQVSVCLQVARGMEHLSNQRFVLRDLAARNCLISAKRQVKVSALGLSKDVYNRWTYTRQPERSRTFQKPTFLPKIEMNALRLDLFHRIFRILYYSVFVFELFASAAHFYEWGLKIYITLNNFNFSDFSLLARQ